MFVAGSIISDHFWEILRDQSVENFEFLWNQMFSSLMSVGQSGIPIMALSGVDLALWDALGKLHEKPVYKLLGGSTKQHIPLYATTTDLKMAQNLGFSAGKVVLPCGAREGDQGLKKDFMFLKECREQVCQEKNDANLRIFV